MVNQSIDIATYKHSHWYGFNRLLDSTCIFNITLYQPIELVVSTVSFSLSLLVSRPEAPLSNAFYKAACLLSCERYSFAHLPRRNNISPCTQGEGAALLCWLQHKP